jgi:hypothetical protein
MRRIVLLATVPAGLCVPPAQAAPKLERCGGALCGTPQRPLDPARPDGAATI